MNARKVPMLMKLPKNACRARPHAKSASSQPHNAPGACQGIRLVPLPHLTQLLSASKSVPRGPTWTRLKGFACPVGHRATLAMAQRPSVCHASQAISGLRENLNAIRSVLWVQLRFKAPHSV